MNPQTRFGPYELYQSSNRLALTRNSHITCEVISADAVRRGKYRVRVMTDKKQYSEIIPQGGAAWMLPGVDRAPWTYRWLPNGARHDPHGHGWAFRDGVGKREKPRTHQAAFAGACGRWLLRGQLGCTPAGAVIRRHEGYWHFLNGEWQGPYKWHYTSDHPECFAIAVLPVRKWVAKFGKLPDLPLRTFVPRRLLKGDSGPD